MPLYTNAGSYLSTAQEFLAHWLQVQTAGFTLTLQGGYGSDDFEADRTALMDASDAVASRENAVGAAAVERDRQKTALSQRLGQFRNTVRGLLPASNHAQGLPTVPGFTVIESRFLRPLVDMADLWTRINADTTVPGFTPPLLLAGGYTITQFRTGLTLLRAAYAANTNATGEAQAARRTRDGLLPPLRERMNQYRALAKALLPAGHPLLATLPPITPPAGSTPGAVILSGGWNETGAQAALSWPASDHPDLDHYSLRAYTGPGAYRAADERVVARVPKEATQFSSDFGLLSPGAETGFKLYVVTRTGNEKGSNAIRIAHPA